MILLVGSVCEGKKLTIVMVKGSLVLISVHYYEYVDVLIAGHIMMMFAVNSTRRRHMNNVKGRMH